MSSFTDWKGYSISLVFHNELGTSMPITLIRWNCTSVLGDLIRDDSDGHDEIQHSSWIGFSPS